MAGGCEVLVVGAADAGAVLGAVLALGEQAAAMIAAPATMDAMRSCIFTAVVISSLIRII